MIRRGGTILPAAAWDKGKKGTFMLKPASLFTDGAVLCRNKEIRIFGEADSGADVTAALLDRRGEVLAEAACRSRDGRFLVLLCPQKAQTGCRLVIRSGEERAETVDVAIGEVFLAGGQSNMELELRNADEGADIIREYRDPLLRFFNVPKIAVEGPEQRKANEAARWHAVAPGQGGENSAVAYFFAAKLRLKMPEIPIGIIGCYWGGTSITCWMEEETLRTEAEGARYLDEYAARCAGKSMETWLKEDRVFQDTINAWNGAVERFREAHPNAPWKEAEAACGPAPWFPPAGPGSPYRPAGLAVTMVREVVPATLTAILYYQGEEDADKTDRYDVLMELLIRTWRTLFREPELPFLFVQLPMWLDWDAEDRRSWARLRLAQAKTRDAVPGTGMICLLDQGEYGNIHPTAKRPVGERLAELAGAMIFGGGKVSPRATGISAEGDALTVRLSLPVKVRGGGEAALLEVAGEDGQYAPAKAEIRGTEIRLASETVKQPVKARYAWTDWSDRVNLFGENGLPLEPFDL